jgi:hypothetical protein
MIARVPRAGIRMECGGIHWCEVKADLGAVHAHVARETRAVPGGCNPSPAAYEINRWTPSKARPQMTVL